MNKRENDGGPAFPQPLATACDGTIYNTLEQSNGTCGGLSIRDYFAAKALEGTFARSNVVNLSDLAEWCYKTADVMLKAREL